MVRARVGQFVVHPNAVGLARIGAVDGSRVRIEWFDSVARPVADEAWVPVTEVRRERLGVQTRVFWQDTATGRWTAGRVVGGGPDVYFVRVPNSEQDVQVEECALRVRWEQPLSDPLQVLIAGAQESPAFRDARLPVLCGNIAERAACASVTAIVSSRVDLHAHQIDTAMQVLADPVQRYLLADEVGLGKTIEAGFVIRQHFLDDPASKVVVVTPDSLRRQWLEEMLGRFFVDDFPRATFKVASHEAPDKWARFQTFDLVVVDEAHRLVPADPTASPYPELRALCHVVPRLLLLSATPVLQRESTHLGLLHLLDPDLYRWADLASFRQRLEVRRALARGVYALDPQLPFLLPDAVDDIRKLLPRDERFEQLANAAMAMLDDNGDVVADAHAGSLDRAVEALRGHVSETYRLHRRIIRHRRATVVGAELDDDGLLPGFEVTGRQRPVVVALTSAEHRAAVAAVEDWQVAVRDAALDTGIDLAMYAAAFAVLVSRTGGPADDLRDTFRWRLDNDDAAADRAALSTDERRALRAAPVLEAERAIARALDEAERDGLAEVVRQLAPAARPDRAVVFAGPGALAAEVADALGRIHSAVHRHIAAAGAERSEAAVSVWRAQGGILVCDDTADDGRNFQLTNLVVHLRLPANPNELEQRIGRVDRYGREQAAGQVLFGDATASIAAAWRRLLIGTYRLFDRSLSALQDAVVRDLDAVWLAALEDGDAGMAAVQPRIEQTITDELRSLAELDLLEASYDAGRNSRNLALEIARYEGTVRSDRHPFLRLVTGKDGFRMAERRRGDGRIDVEPTGRESLLSPRLLLRLGSVPPDARKAYVDRWLALKNGGRLFRVGNPLVDAVATILDIDDRGRACAHWRMDPTWESDPLPYFGFVYLVEADLTAALRVVDGRARQALRRRADRALPPFTRTVWLPADDHCAVTDPVLLRWLMAPYRNDADDVNLSRPRLGALHELFGGEDGFSAAAMAAAEAARPELERVSDLCARCDAAADALRDEGAVLAAQAKARAAAGRLLDDDESLVLDRNLNAALVAGVDAPHVQLLAVTCLVRSRRRWSAHAR